MAENGILKVGRVTDFECHQMEHQLGAYTDCNHGQGLAVLHPAYYRHILKDAPEKFARFAQERLGCGGHRRRPGGPKGHPGAGSIYPGVRPAHQA